MLINFNHLKTFYNALIQKVKGFRGNWNQNDPSADDYIKNRPFYSEGIKEQEIVSERIVEGFLSLSPLLYAIQDPFSFSPILGESYVVTWDGAEYEVTAANANDCVYIGNENYVFMESGGSIPFTLLNAGETLFLVTESPSNSHTIKIVIKTEVVHKLDKKFIDVDMPDNVITEDSLFPILEDNLAPVSFTNDYDSLSGKPTIYTDVVRYEESQSLTDDQKAQARTNIGAISLDDVCDTKRTQYSVSWDGVVENSLGDYFVYNGTTYYKVSDTVIDLDDIVNYTSYHLGKLTLTSTTYQYWGTNCYNLGYAIVIMQAGSCRLKYNPSISTTISFNAPSTGIYFPKLSYSTYENQLDITYNADNLSNNIMGVVRYDAQTLTGAEKEQARINIGAGTSNFSGSYNDLTDKPEPFDPNTLATVASTGSYNDLIDKPEYSITLKDVDTSYRYNVFIKNGTLTTSIACASIRVDSIPYKEYLEGDKLDLSDAVVIAAGEDGSERQVTGFTYPEVVPSADNPEITIHYTEFDRDFIAIATLPSIKSMRDVLIDFEYTAEADGTYTITGWKETLNGEPSTELIIPDNKLINL